MTLYTETLSIAAPVELSGIAAAIALALDPDVGGGKSFHPDPSGKTISMTTRCTPEFKAQAIGMLADPAALHAVVQADYARRWGGLTPPTLSECEAFCSVVQLSTVSESF